MTNFFGETTEQPENANLVLTHSQRISLALILIELSKVFKLSEE